MGEKIDLIGISQTFDQLFAPLAQHNHILNMVDCQQTGQFLYQPFPKGFVQQRLEAVAPSLLVFLKSLRRPPGVPGSYKLRTATNPGAD